MKISVSRFLQDESGVTVIEYALIAAGMAAAVITTISILSDGLIGGMESIAAKMTSGS